MSNYKTKAVKRYLKAVDDYLNMDRVTAGMDIDARFAVLDEYRAAKKVVERLVEEWEYTDE